MASHDPAGNQLPSSFFMNGTVAQQQPPSTSNQQEGSQEENPAPRRSNIIWQPSADMVGKWFSTGPRSGQGEADCADMSFNMEAMRKLNEMRINNQLTDGILRSQDGAEFPVHRGIMCSCSPYFR
jgi:hypothetical protein